MMLRAEARRDSLSPIAIDPSTLLRPSALKLRTFVSERLSLDELEEVNPEQFGPESFDPELKTEGLTAEGPVELIDLIR